MQEYIDITQSTVFIGFVGLIAPFLFPLLFKLISKIAKRKLSNQEKRLVITVVSFLVSIGVVAFHFEWKGEFMIRAWAFIMFLAVNYLTLRGMVQTIYELIIKNFPVVEKRLDKIEK